jgi:hypothetical protein
LEFCRLLGNVHIALPLATGTGKRHLATALGVEAVKAGPIEQSVHSP